LRSACPQVRMPSSSRGRRPSGPGATSGQPAAAQRPHHHHPKAQLLGQGKDLLLHLPLEGVVGHLDGVDPPASHDLGKLSELRGQVVRGPKRPGPALGPQLLELGRALGPADQVVHLPQVYPAAEQAERALVLRAGLRGAGGPHLRRHESLVPAIAERWSQHPLRLPVHRRGVEEVHARLESGLYHPGRPLLLFRPPDVEGSPGPHPDDGDLEPAAPERAPLHLRRQAAVASARARCPAPRPGLPDPPEGPG
jgi:hypothetical protein